MKSEIPVNGNGGSIKKEEMTQEQITDVRRASFVKLAELQIKSGKIQGQNKKQLENQIKLASKHSFWDGQPVKKFMQEKPK